MVFSDGGPGEDRTLDLCVANAALSQLSYGPKVKSPDTLYRDLVRRKGFEPPTF